MSTKATEGSDIPQQIEQLKQRVQTLENKVWVAVAVAAIFGVTGAFGYSQLHDAQKELSELKDGIQAVQKARDVAIRDITDTKNAQIADIRAQAVPIARDAATQEMQTQIGQVKTWTKFVYSEAARIGMPNHEGANGWWQKSLIDKNALVQEQLR